VLSELSGYGYADDFRAQNAKAIKAMTLEDFKALAAKYLRPDAMNYLVGRAAKPMTTPAHRAFSLIGIIMASACPRNLWQDLTRQILDTDARLKAQTTLRDRLQGLLATRNAELKDLLALERELARVQGQIESATTTLNVLRKRVSMSVVDINYQSQSVAVSQSALAPIGRALKGFVGQFAYGLSNVIEFFAGILPWLIFVIIPGLWVLRRWWRGRNVRPKPKAKTP